MVQENLIERQIQSRAFKAEFRFKMAHCSAAVDAHSMQHQRRVHIVRAEDVEELYITASSLYASSACALKVWYHEMF